MKHIIIGTAGHVDHGKTLLVKALTGTDTDRLKEEKKRGITIELGFAHIEFDGEIDAGIVDVPGHEGFIKNMLMGAGGIDFAMLVVAADEGFMPQTIEHLDILTLLGVKSGIVVLTKKDLVDEDWLEIITEDAKEQIKNTFLEQCAIIPVSAYTGEGIDLLREKLKELSLAADEKNSHAPFRIAADRVFSIDGFGTVITGTLTEGMINTEDEVSVYPKMIKARVRNLQVHSKDVKTAFAGQRVAINLSGIKKSEIEKGDIIAKPDSLILTDTVDVRLRVLEKSKRSIKHNSIVHFFHGATSQLCKVKLLDKNEINHGDAGFARLILETNIALKEKDRFVVRFFSPLETIGGGVILDPTPKLLGKKDRLQAIENLKIRESGSDDDKILSLVKESAASFESFEKSSKSLNIQVDLQKQILKKLIENGQIFPYGEEYYIDFLTLSKIKEQLTLLLNEYHLANPLSCGIKREELRQKLFKKIDVTLCDNLLEIMEGDRAIAINAGVIATYGWSVIYSPRHQKILQQIERELLTGGFSPPSVDELYTLFPKDKDGCRQVMGALINDGNIIMLTSQIPIHKEFYDQSIELIRNHFKNNEEITLGQMRDLMGTSRKYTLALLEHFDKLKYTKMQGESRTLLNPF